MKTGILRLKEITYMEMGLVAAIAILSVLLIKMVAGTWFLLPMIPALMVSLFASYGLMQDKEFRFEGVLFTFLGYAFIVGILVDTVRAAL